MIRAILAALLVAACATPRSEPTPSQARVQQEREEDRVRTMQDEFNTLFPDG